MRCRATSANRRTVAGVTACLPELLSIACARSASICAWSRIALRQMKTLQRFASVHANVHNHFDLQRHLVDRHTYKERRSAALAEWRILAS
jgi:hypothetical protein